MTNRPSGTEGYGETADALAKHYESVSFADVHREIYAEIPPRVEYSLTTLGRSLEPVVRMLWTWGNDYLGGRQPHPAALNGAARRPELVEH